MEFFARLIQDRRCQTMRALPVRSRVGFKLVVLPSLWRGLACLGVQF